MISVCMATYNGERFVKQQIESILSQLDIDDELIISDDGSSDSTLEIIDSFHDSRIRLIKGGFHSPIFNFENAIKNAKGDYIFMSDQDDVWKEGRVREAIKYHEEHGITLLICKAELINSEGVVIKESFYDEDDPTKHSLLYNLYRNPFLGCCMSYKKELLSKILPFPRKIAMHDPWIGLVAQCCFSCGYYNEKALVQYRRHGINYTATHKYSIAYKIWYRLYYLFHLIKIKVSH